MGKKKTKSDVTVGKASLDLRESTESYDARELEQEIHKGSNSEKSYEEEIWTCVENAQKDSSIAGDFFIVVLLKKERHLTNVVRQYFFYRSSCPTPEWDQTVYKYEKKGGKLSYIWTVPDKETCMRLPLYKSSLPPEQQLLLSMINSFHNGELEKLAERLNNEPPNIILL